MNIMKVKTTIDKRTILKIMNIIINMSVMTIMNNLNIMNMNLEHYEK